MVPHRSALCAAALAVALGLAAAVVRSPREAAAAEAVPAPGQLTLLDAKGQPAGLCPLKHTGVKADVSGSVARVDVRQEFENTAKEPVEAVYTFPLPEDAAVDAMTMTLGDRVIRSQIKRREEARAIYEAAKNAGQAAALLDQERPNIFTQSLANLMPGQKVTVSISYVQLLKYDEGGYQFVFPMVVGPRYTPGGGYTVPGKRGEPSPAVPVEGDPGARSVVTDADRITPPITPPATRAGHDISLEVKLDAGVPLREVRSQLHEVRVDRQGEDRAVVRLREEKTIPNKDFILRYTVAGDRLQTGLLAHAQGNGGGYFTLVLQPPAAPPQKEISPKEMVFVIDQTGSQSGFPIEKSKETIRFCLENMNPGDTFQVLGFNTQVFPCFSGAVPVTPENVKQALAFLEPLQGNGGTDILKACEYALKMPDDPGRLRIVAYFTDGYVGNDMQILDYIRKNRGRARMFPFGIGNSVNRFLIEGMAKEGKGAAEVVTLNTPGEKPASRFYDRVARPLLLDVAVDWNGLPVEDVYPKAIPDVFTSGPILLKGRYLRAGEGEITVRGLLRGQPWSQKVRVSLPAVEKSGAALPALWAREKIEDLQGQDWLGAQTGRTDPKIKEQIVNLALDYGLMSQYTSFVAVEERVVNVGGKQRKVDVPVEMPEGVSYEGIFGREAKRGGAAPGLYFKQSAVGAQGYGGFGGGMSGGPAPAAPSRALSRRPRTSGAVSAGKPVQLEELEQRDDPSPDLDIARGTEESRKQLAAMKPEERRAALERAKLHESLRGLAEKVRKEGRNGSLKKAGVPEVTAGRVEVQVWLNELPADALKQLQGLGFELAATLRPKQLLLGTVPVEKLPALLELSFVRQVEPPKFR